MSYGIVHQFPGGTKEQYEASIAAVHRVTAAFPRGRSSTLRGRRLTAGSSSPFTTRRRVGSASATRTWSESCVRTSKPDSPRPRRRRPSPFTTSRRA